MGLILNIWGGFDSAAVAQFSTSLNSDIKSLHSRVNRLEPEVRFLRSNSSNPKLPEQRSPIANNQEPNRSHDPLFDRLAILLIELKEDVHDLEQRVILLEQKQAN